MIRAKQKRKLVRIMIEMIKELVAKYESNACMSALASEFGMPKGQVSCKKSIQWVSRLK